ncbi:MAG: hypothetical protein RQM90_13495 [Methanoculleus sp.]
MIEYRATGTSEHGCEGDYGRAGVSSVLRGSGATIPPGAGRSLSAVRKMFPDQKHFVCG